jgi:hypothetical protein
VKANLNNYTELEHFLKKNNIEYVKINEYQYRILGDVALVDVWPARMTVHVIATESVDPNRYFRLSYYFNAAELTDVLNGKYHGKN